MDDPDLAGYHIFLAEDESLVALSLARMLQIWGAIIVGPAPTLDKALTLVSSCEHIDAAIIDVNLRGQMTFPLADVLLTRGALLIFTTGFDSLVLPERYRCVATLEKPYNSYELACVLRPLTAERGSSH